MSAGILALLLTPLLVWNRLIFPHTTTKTYFILLLSELIFICFVYLLSHGTRTFHRFVLIDKLFFAFVGTIVITSLLGIDPIQSFWGALDRMTGWLLWIHLALLFIVLRQTIRSHKEWHTLFWFSINVAAIISVLHLLSRAGVKIWLPDQGGATFGNSSFFATFILFHLFFSIFAFATSPSSRRRWVCILLGTLFLLTIWTTDALAVQITSLGGLGLFGASFLASQKKRSKQLAGIILLILLSVSFVFSMFFAFQKGSALNDELIARSSGARFVIWDIAWQGIKERPILGWGLENFQTVFLKHYNPCLGTSRCGREMWYDRAHNNILDIWIQSGILGLILYLTISLIAILTVWRPIIKSGQNPLLGCAAIAILIAYFVQNITAFDTSVSLFYWTILIAFMGSMDTQSSLLAKRQMPVSAWKLAAWCITFTLPISLWLFVVQPARANLALVRLRHDTDVQARLRDYRIATSISPLGRDMRRVFAAYETKLELWKVPVDSFSSIRDIASYELNLGIDALQKNIRRPANRLRSFISLGILYQTAGNFIDPKAYGEAERAFRQAIESSPRHPQAKWALASVYLSQERYSEAKSLVQEVIDLGTDSLMARTYELMVLKWIDEEEFEREALRVLDSFPQLASTVATLRAVDLSSPAQRQAFLTTFH